MKIWKWNRKSPVFCDWAFMKPRGQPIQEIWNKIPDGIDILVTHSPPLGHGDLAISKLRAGCLNLLHTIQSRVKPRYHIFGHIHEGYGITTDGVTTFVNASSVTVQYKPSHPPIVFDLPNKESLDQSWINFCSIYFLLLIFSMWHTVFNLEPCFYMLCALQYYY